MPMVGFSKVSKTKTDKIARRLRVLAKSVPGIVEDAKGKFEMGERKVWLAVGKRKVVVEPIKYWYSSIGQVKEEEFELKDAIHSYLKSGFTEPRLTFEEREENGRNILYCIMTGAAIRTEFRPKWYELLNGVNRMVFTEYKNAKTRKKDRMEDILKSLRKITKRAESHCKELGYDI